MDSSSDDSDSPLVDKESGFPIVVVGANEPVPKLSYDDTVRLKPSRKRPKSYRRRKKEKTPPKENPRVYEYPDTHSPSRIRENPASFRVESGNCVGGGYDDDPLGKVLAFPCPPNMNITSKCSW